jgi:hypothetical protein
MELGRVHSDFLSVKVAACRHWFYDIVLVTCSTRYPRLKDYTWVLAYDKSSCYDMTGLKC